MSQSKTRLRKYHLAAIAGGAAALAGALPILGVAGLGALIVKGFCVVVAGAAGAAIPFASNGAIQPATVVAANPSIEAATTVADTETTKKEGK